MASQLVLSEVARFFQLSTVGSAIWVGRDPYSWSESLQVGLGRRFNLDKYPISRVSLRRMWKTPTVPAEACILSTLAWGGMHRSNGRLAWSSLSNWLPLCESIRAGELTRAAGYAAFSELRSKGEMPGMGVAYFTKLLFFANPKEDSYILDQWTARSIHILTRQDSAPLLIKDYGSLSSVKQRGVVSRLRLYVSDKVTTPEYLEYCLLIEEIGEIVDMHPHMVEERLFGSGGSNPCSWRKHVMRCWNEPSFRFYT